MRIDGTSIFNDFRGGINVAVSPYHLPQNQYRDGNNIYLTKRGELRKRRGRTLFNITALGSAVHSLHRLYIGGSTGFLAAASTVLYNDNALTGTFTSTQAGLTGNSIRGMVFPGDDWFYFCDGINMFKYNLTVVRIWGIVAPTTAITATPVGAGSAFPITSGYTYGYTFYNSVTGHESEYLTSTGTGPDPTADRVDVVITASADAQVTNIKLYRTFDGGNTFYLHSTNANTTDTIADTTADGALGASYGADGNDPPAAAKDCCVMHKRMILAGANMTIQVSQLAEPESYPNTTGYRFTLKHGMGVDVVRIWPYEKGTQNALLAFKDRSIVAIYGLQDESPSNWEFRVVDPENGLHAANSIAEGFNRIYWMSVSDGGDYKIFEFGPEGIRSISMDIEPLFRETTATLLAASVGWFYDGKYFISFPQSSDSTANDCIYFYDLRTQGWHPYTKAFGVSSVAVFRGSGDSGQLYVGDTSDGYVDLADVADTFGDRSIGYKINLKTRFDDGGAAARKKKYWLVTAEMESSIFDVVVRTDRGFSSPHTSSGIDGGGWLGGWIGGWLGRNGKILEQKIRQGIKGRYTALDFASKNNIDDAAIIMGAVDFEVEADT